MMLKRRSDMVATTQGLLEEVSGAPIDWPEKSVCLERDSLLQYRQRSMTGDVSVAELYHENSKLCPGSLARLRASKLDPAELREEVLRRRASAAAEGSGYPTFEPTPQLSHLIRRSMSTNAADLYAVELVVVQDGVFAVLEPRSGVLQMVKQLLPAELEALRRAIRLTAPPDLKPSTGPHLVLFGNFARNEILFGVRGYRRTLIEAGQVAQRIMESAAQLGLRIWPVYEFADRDLDDVLDLDGTERSALIAFELMGEP